jgi:hypothetical protein
MLDIIAVVAALALTPAVYWIMQGIEDRSARQQMDRLRD